MFKFSRRARIVLIFLVIVAVGYGIVRLIQSSGAVPQAFTDARRQGAIIAQNIVDLSNQSTADLERVNQLDDKGNYKDALALVTNLVSKSADIRDQAVALSSQVAEMTKALSDISDFQARQAALESISSRLAVLSQLISYSADLARIEGVLQERFAGLHGAANAEIQALVTQVNIDVNAINNFNTQAGKAMDRFDKIVGK